MIALLKISFLFILLQRGDGKCDKNFPSLSRIRSSSATVALPKERQYIFRHLSFSCDAYITKIIYKGELWNSESLYPIIQTWDEGIPILADYVREESVYYYEIAAIYQGDNGTVELIPNKPIKVDDDTVMGLYIPKNSTAFYCEENRLLSSEYYYDKTSRPLRLFHLIQATHEQLIVPLITVELSTSSQPVLTKNPSSTRISTSSTILSVNPSNSLHNPSETPAMTTVSSIAPSADDNNQAYYHYQFPILPIALGVVALVITLIVLGFSLVICILVRRLRKPKLPVRNESNLQDRSYVLHPLQQCQNTDHHNSMVLNQSYSEIPINPRYDRLMWESSMTSSHNHTGITENRCVINPAYTPSLSYSQSLQLPLTTYSTTRLSSREYEELDNYLCENSIRVPREYEEPCPTLPRMPIADGHLLDTGGLEDSQKSDQ